MILVRVCVAVTLLSTCCFSVFGFFGRCFGSGFSRSGSSVVEGVLLFMVYGERYY